MSYSEHLRPQFHFSARSGWLNDPNGLVAYGGEYHLYFQHSPTVAESGGSKAWGHAVSRDLVHWRQLAHAIEPYAGGAIWSGSAVVDHDNTSGFGAGSEPPLVAAFTHARIPFGQALAYSTDHGRSWALYQGGRPVVANQGLDECERDPRILWHAPTKRWVMVLWVRRGTARLFVSRNLRDWEWASDAALPGFYECPDLFELPVDGRPGETRWVLHDASFCCWIGLFDGRTFVVEEGPIRGEHGSAFYAAQTWTNVPGRCVQIGWMRGGAYPGMPFSQQMSVPCALTLHQTATGLRVFRTPVPELEVLRAAPLTDGARRLHLGDSALQGVHGDMLDLELAVSLDRAAKLALRLYGHEIELRAEPGAICCAGCEAPLEPSDGLVSLRVLVDRTSLEIFGNGGASSLSLCFVPEAEETEVGLTVQGGSAELHRLMVYRLRSTWPTGGR